MIKPFVLTHLAAPFFPTTSPKGALLYTELYFIRKILHRVHVDPVSVTDRHYHARSPATASSLLHQRETDYRILALCYHHLVVSELGNGRTLLNCL